MLAVAMLALVVTPPGPPALAEFAPRAEDRIDEALKAQSSTFGTGEGGDCAAGQDCATGGGVLGGTTTTTAPPPGHRPVEIDKARVRRCLGDPPRQTEDPQSPPCINYFEGDNGGATSKGVTRDEVRIAVTRGQYDYARLLVDHFNRRYEFYGRKLRLVTVPYASEPRLLAVSADEEAKAFAMIIDDLHGEKIQQEAARRHVVSALGAGGYADSGLYREMAPYAWTYAPAIDEIETSLGRFTCTSLGLGLARFAGAELRAKPRRYAVVTSKEGGQRPDLSALHATLSGCGIPVPDTVEIDQGSDDDAAYLSNTYARWQQDEITSILILAAADETTQFMSKLPKSFEPEWVVSGVNSHDNEAQWMVAAPPNHRRSLFGTFTSNKLLPKADTPSYWAFLDGPGPTEADETIPRDPAGDGNFTRSYHAMLMLASGIQMAGANLTPESFAVGLQKAKFPNPGFGAAPYYQGHVDFGPGDFAMVDAASVVWWSDTTPSYGGGGVSKEGGWCYVRKGARFDANWTDVSSELFNPDPRACR
jgi:hypothetical protein